MPTGPRRIYVDLDDVLAETGRMFLRVLEREFDRVVAFADLRSFHLGESLSLDDDELGEFMERVHQPDELVGIAPLPGALEAVATWVERGYEVHVVTGRPETTREASLAWLDKHSVPYAAFHFLDKYSKTYGEAHHGPRASLTLADLPGLGFCMAVEDFAGITPHLADELGIPVALIDRPWNRTFDDHDGHRAPIVRCRDWSAIVERFPRP